MRAQSPCQLAACFAPWVPTALFPKAPDHANSRDHDYTRWRTFWCMPWQGLNLILVNPDGEAAWFSDGFRPNSDLEPLIRAHLR